MDTRRCRTVAFATLVALHGAAAVIFAATAGAIAEVHRYTVLPLFALTHLLHKAGLPGLLEKQGLCGWGWCAPTPLGWLVASLVWFGAFWLAGVIACALLRRLVSRG